MLEDGIVFDTVQEAVWWFKGFEIGRDEGIVLGRSENEQPI